MQTISINQNMGQVDRLVRGGLGVVLLVDSLRSGITQSPWRLLESLVGGAFVVYGLTGFDPLLAKYGLSTDPNHPLFISSRINRALPGSMISPRDTEQPVPMRYTQGRQRPPMKSLPQKVREMQRKG